MRTLVTVALVVTACTQEGGEVVRVPSPTVPPVSPPETTLPSSETTLRPSASSAPSTTTLPPLQSLAAEVVASGLPFPIFVTAPAGEERLFIATKDGTVWVMGDGSPAEFLDIRGLVRNRGEQGLLGLAFHPRYPMDPRFFVHYTDNGGDTTLAAYRVSADPDLADPDSAEILLEVDQPASNHNGGMLVFGPDGYLYLGLGDGGGANDVFGNGQRPDTLLGTILRLDVDVPAGYGIPSDNPFVEGGGAPEVWAYGLRNPWRFWFDGSRLFIGDVGQGAYEEIDVVSIGAAPANFGWPITEGLHCFRPSQGCDTDRLTLPVLEIPHSDSGTCSVTGGVVYRGSTIPELDGWYFFSDYCGGYLRALDGDDVVDVTDQVGHLGRVTSFGVDGFGEVYITNDSGDVLRLVARR